MALSFPLQLGPRPLVADGTASVDPRRTKKPSDKEAALGLALGWPLREPTGDPTWKGPRLWAYSERDFVPSTRPLVVRPCGVAASVARPLHGNGDCPRVVLLFRFRGSSRFRVRNQRNNQRLDNQRGPISFSLLPGHSVRRLK